jgi:hypothetical protein
VLLVVILKRNVATAAHSPPDRNMYVVLEQRFQAIIIQQ